MPSLEGALEKDHALNVASDRDDHDELSDKNTSYQGYTIVPNNVGGGRPKQQQRRGEYQVDNIQWQKLRPQYSPIATLYAKLASDGKSDDVSKDGSSKSSSSSTSKQEKGKKSSSGEKKYGTKDDEDDMKPNIYRDVCTSFAHAADAEISINNDEDNLRSLNFQNSSVRRATMSSLNDLVENIHSVPVDSLVTFLFARFITHTHALDQAKSWKCWFFADSFNQDFIEQFALLQHHIIYSLRYDLLDLIYRYRELSLAYCWLRYMILKGKVDVASTADHIESRIIFRQHILALSGEHSIADPQVLTDIQKMLRCADIFHGIPNKFETFSAGLAQEPGWKEPKGWKFGDEFTKEQMKIVDAMSKSCYTIFSNIQRYRCSIPDVPTNDDGTELVKDDILDDADLDGEEDTDEGPVGGMPEEMAQVLQNTTRAFNSNYIIKLKVIRRRIQLYSLNYKVILGNEENAFTNNRLNVIQSVAVWFVGIIVPLLASYIIGVDDLS